MRETLSINPRLTCTVVEKLKSGLEKSSIIGCRSAPRAAPDATTIITQGALVSFEKCSDTMAMVGRKVKETPSPRVRP